MRSSPRLADLSTRDLDRRECQEAVQEFCRCNRLVPPLLVDQALGPAAPQVLLVGGHLALAQLPVPFGVLFDALYLALHCARATEFPLHDAEAHWRAVRRSANETRARLQRASKQHVPTRVVGDMALIAELPARERLWQAGRQRQRGREGQGRLPSAHLSPWYSTDELRLLLE